VIFKRTVLLTTVLLFIYALLFYFYFLFRDVSIQVLNLIFLLPFLITFLTFIIRSRKKQGLSKSIKAIDEFIFAVCQFIQNHFKFLLLYCALVAIIFACIAKITFDSHIQEGLRFHHYLCLYSLNISSFAILVPLFALMFKFLFGGLQNNLKE
jgi:hypothetical protein